MFITLEGLDGAGKSVALDAIRSEFSDVVVTSEPSELWTGEAVRRVLQDTDSNPLTDFYLFMADRVHHIENDVIPAEEGGRLVVSSRYADSTRAYQPVTLVEEGVFDSRPDAIAFIEETMAPWDYEPDLTIYLDVSVETALGRCDKQEKYENREMLKTVREHYEMMSNYFDRYTRVDAEQSPTAVQEEVREIVAAAVDRKT